MTGHDAHFPPPPPWHRPPAFHGCVCTCHVFAGVKHLRACCSPYMLDEKVAVDGRAGNLVRPTTPVEGVNAALDELAVRLAGLKHSDPLTLGLHDAVNVLRLIVIPRLEAQQ